MSMYGYKGAYIGVCGYTLHVYYIYRGMWVWVYTGLYMGIQGYTGLYEQNTKK